MALARRSRIHTPRRLRQRGKSPAFKGDRSTERGGGAFCIGRNAIDDLHTDLDRERSAGDGRSILGVGLGYSMLRVLLAAMPKLTLPWGVNPALNPYVYLFLLRGDNARGPAFGCTPAWYASRIDPGTAMKSGGQAGPGVGRHRLQRMFVVSASWHWLWRLSQGRGSLCIAS